MASPEPPGGSGPPGLQRATFGSQEWQEMLKQQFGDSPLDLTEESPLFRLTSDGALLDELLKTLSGGEALELSPLFSDKTLNALMGAQIQQYAAEAAQEDEGSQAGQPEGPANALDAALQLLQPGGAGGAASSQPQAQAQAQAQPRFSTLQEAAEAIGLVQRAGGGGGGGGLQRAGGSSGLLRTGASGGSAMLAQALAQAAAAAAQAQQQQREGAAARGAAQQAQQQVEPRQRGQHMAQQVQQQPAAQPSSQAAQQQAQRVTVLDGQVVIKDGTVQLQALPRGQQLRLQVPGPDGSVRFIPVLDSRVVALPGQPTLAPQQAPQQAQHATAAAAPLQQGPQLAQQGQRWQQRAEAGGAAQDAAPGFSFQQAQQSQQLQSLRQDSVPLPAWLQPPAQQGPLAGLRRHQEQQQRSSGAAGSTAAAAAAAAAAAVASLAVTAAMPRVSSHPTLSTLPLPAAPAAPALALPAMPRSGSHNALPAMLPLPTAPPARRPTGAPVPEAAAAAPADAGAGASAALLDIAATQQLVAAAQAQQQVLQRRAASGQLPPPPGPLCLLTPQLPVSQVLTPAALAQHPQQAQQAQQQQLLPPLEPSYSSHSAHSSQQQQQQLSDGSASGAPAPAPAQQAPHQAAAATLPMPIPTASQQPLHGLARSCPEAALASGAGVGGLGGGPFDAATSLAITPREHCSEGLGAAMDLAGTLPDSARSGAGAGASGYYFRPAAFLSPSGSGVGVGAGAGGAPLPSKPCHKRERSMRSANPDALGITPAPKAACHAQQGQQALLQGAGASMEGIWEGAAAAAGCQQQQQQLLPPYPAALPLLHGVPCDSSGGGTTTTASASAHSPLASLSGVQDQFFAFALGHQGGGGSSAAATPTCYGSSYPPASSAALLGGPGGAGPTAASAALLLASPPGAAAPAAAVHAGTAGGGGGSRRGKGRGSARGGGGGGSGAAVPPRPPAAPSSVDEEEINAIIGLALAKPPGKRRGRPPGRRSGPLPPEYEAELEEASILRELLQDPSLRRLPVDQLKALMRREKNKKMAAFSRTKNVMHVAQLEDKVRKLSEERDWLAQQLLHGPAPDQPPHRMMLPGAPPAPKPLLRHLSM